MEFVTGLNGFFFGLAIFLTISLNGLVLATFFMDKRPLLRTKCIHVLLTNLAVCQLLIGLLVMPFVEISVFYDDWKRSRAVCQLNGFTTSTCFYTAVLMVCVISLDRYVAIVLATKYQRLLTRKRGYTIVAVIWLTASILSMPPLIGWSSYQYHPGTLHCSPVWIGECSYFYFTFTLSVIIPTTLTVVSYIIIFWRIRKHRKRVSMWKHAGKGSDLPTSATDESGIEMSQVPTAHKSTALARQKSEVMEIQNVGDEKEAKTNRITHTRTQKSPLLTTQGITHRSSSWGVVVEEQITAEQTVYPQRRTFILESGDVFYNPNANTSPELEASSPAPKIVGGFQSEELKSSSSELKDSLLARPTNVVENANSESPEIQTSSGRIAKREECSIEDDGFSTAKKDASSKGGQKQRAKKLNIGRILTESRAKKSWKLSDKDVHGLLNLSEGSDARSNSSISSDNRSQTGKENSLIDENKNASNIGYCQEANGQQNAESNSETTKCNGKRHKIRMPSIAGNRKSKKTENRLSVRRSTSKVKRASSTLQEFQVAKTGAILLGVFMVCYGPYTIVHLCNLPFPVPYEAQYFAMWCVFLNSILTPIIYGVMNKETRTKIKLLLKKCWCCS